MSRRVKVSIVTITYNHEKFIRQTLEGFVGQKTDFAFEVVVADDCSSDGTQDIIREFAAQYPDIFRPVLRKKNIGAQRNSIEALRAAQGDYIALCEGDDYWTDPRKLQRQADYLDTHKKAALCFHPVKVVYEAHEKPDEVFPAGKNEQDFTVKRLLASNFIQTNSVMYRRQNYANLPDDILPLDWYLHLYHAQFGSIGFINEVMSVYRRHAGGLWWQSPKGEAAFWGKHGIAHLKMFQAALELYGTDKTDARIIQTNVRDLFNTLARLDVNGTHMLPAALAVYPEFAAHYIQTLYQENQERKKQVARLNLIAEERAKMITTVQSAVEALQAELVTIHGSKSWKLARKISSVKGTLQHKKPG